MNQKVLNNILIIAVVVMGLVLSHQSGLFRTDKDQKILDEESEAALVVVADELSDELDVVKAEFEKIEFAEDRKLIHKLFAGGGDYLLVCETLLNTSQFDPLLGKVQSSYGWDREKYPDFTDAVSDYLVSVGYDTPKELTSKSDRRDFAEIFVDLAEATKYE